MNVWFPLDQKVHNINDVNNRLAGHDTEVVELTITGNTIPSEVSLHQDTIDLITSTIGKLQSRLDPSVPIRKPEYAIVTLDDAPDWPLIY